MAEREKVKKMKKLLSKLFPIRERRLELGRYLQRPTLLSKENPTT